jgi:cytochrome c oxidase assembly protein subunit 15
VLVVLVVQGTVGYAQYFNGIPVPLVALHVTGSVVVWWLVCRLTFATRTPSSASAEPIADAARASVSR